MKKLSYPLIAAVASLLIASASQVQAGGSSSCCDDGIAASPKVRAILDERCKSHCTAPAQMAVTTTRHTDIAASPRVQQMRHERMPRPVFLSSETASYRATGSDG